MKKDVTIIKDAIVLIVVGENFVTFPRYTDENGFAKAKFSFPLSGELADRIESSKIVKVEKISGNGVLRYRRLEFYTTERIIEIFTDLINFYNQK